jgi:hypothetical protein
LFIGTPADNNADKEAKGRSVVLCGDEHGMSKLSWTRVSQIRNAYSTGRVTQVELSKRFGVSGASISNIVRNVSWKAK